MKKLCVVLLAALLLCGCLASPGASGGASSTSLAAMGTGGSSRRDAVQSGELQFTAPGEGAVYATLKTSRGDIRLVLYPEHAPLAVENFCTLASRGYYDGTEFHRVVADFAIQGGDATGTGYGGESAWGQPLLTERSDTLRHYSGAICMAAEDEKADTHRSQFYIVATPQGNLAEDAVARMRSFGQREAVVEAYRQAGGAPWLDYNDTVFGQVVAGMDVVDKIARAAASEDGRPKSPVTVDSIVLENYQPLYIKGRPMPKKQEEPVTEEKLPDNMDDIPDNDMVDEMAGEPEGAPEE